MGGVLICKDGEMHPKQTRLGGVCDDSDLLIGSITLFVLSIFLGVELITKVRQSHTPLMSGANAISGISVVGAQSERMLHMMEEILDIWNFASFALVLAMINVVGGFAVTNRMLNMIAGKKRGA